MTRPLTGRAVFWMFAGGFGVIIAANLALAISAVRTFPGLETENSYATSQSFDADRAAQEALGWEVRARLADGQVTLSVTGRGGQPVAPAEIDAILGRATQKADDIALDFRPGRGGVLVAEAPGTEGRWNLWLNMRAGDGTKFRQLITLYAENGG